MINLIKKLFGKDYYHEINLAKHAMNQYGEDEFWEYIKIVGGGYCMANGKNQAMAQHVIDNYVVSEKCMEQIRWFNRVHNWNIRYNEERDGEP